MVDARSRVGRAVHDHARQHGRERRPAGDADARCTCSCPSSNGWSRATRSRSPRSCSPAASSPTSSGGDCIFMVGLAVFTGASLACGLAPNGGFLIGARVVQGLGGALMNPATLSIITATFPPRQRGTAIGIWAGVSAMALAIGPLVGGLLTEHVNWNWIFFINVPIGIAGPARDPALHRRVARHLARAAAGRARADHLGDRAVRAHLRVHRGEQLRLDVGADPRLVRRRRSRAPHVRAARAAPAAADAQPRALPQPHVQRCEHGDALHRARDVRDVLLRLAVHAERARLLADPGRRVVPADDAADRRRGAAGRQAVRPVRLALARRRRHDAAHDHAPLLLAARRPRELLGAPARPADRRRRDGPDDDADDGGGDELRARRPGRRRLGRPQLEPAGRRLARDRGDGGDRRVRRRRPAHAGGVPARLPRRAPRRGGARLRRCDRRDGGDPQAGTSGRRRRQWRPRPHDAHGGQAEADGRRQAPRGARHRLPRLLEVELPRRDDGRDRPRGRHQRADPLPPLRLEARPLPRLPRRGLAELPRGLGAGDRRRPRPLPRRDRRRLHGEEVDGSGWSTCGSRR